MKTLFPAIALLFSFVALTAPVLAQEKEEKPKLNLSELAKSAESIKKFKALADNPEALKTMIRLAESLKKSKAGE